MQTIILKTLSKERERRYQGAGELARDIAHYLSGDPIEAKRDSTLYVLRKNMRLYRVPLAVLAAFVLLLITFSVIAWTLYAQSQERLRNSYLAQARAQRVSPRPGRRIDSLAALARAAAIRPGLELRNEAIACLALADVQITEEWHRGPRAQRFHTGFDGGLERAFLYEWPTLKTTVRRLGDSGDLLTLPPPVAVGRWPVPCFSPDGKYLARGAKAECEVWDVDNARLVTKITADVAGQIPVDFSPDGAELAVGAQDGAIHIHNFRSGQTRVLPPIQTPAHHVRYSPEADKLAVSCVHSPDTLVRDALTGEVLQTLAHPAGVWGVDWSPDGRQIATGCEDTNVQVWDTETGIRRFTLKGHLNIPTRTRFMHTGEILISCAWDGTTRFWDPRGGRHLFTLQGTGMRFAADSPMLGFVTHEEGLTWAIAQVQTSNAFRSLYGRPAGTVHGSCQWIRISGDGRLAVSCSTPGVRLWDLAHEREVAYLPIGLTRSAVFHPNGTSLITVGASTVMRWPLRLDSNVVRIGPPEILAPKSENREFWRGCLSADGSTLVVTANRHHAMVVDLAQPAEPRIIESHRGMCYLTISPDTNWVATGAWGGQGVKIWELPSGKLAHELPIPGNTKVAFSPDGRLMAVVGGGGGHQACGPRQA